MRSRKERAGHGRLDLPGKLLHVSCVRSASGSGSSSRIAPASVTLLTLIDE